MAMKEQITDLLGGFLEQYKDYAVEVYVKNGISDNNKESKCIVEWESKETCTSEITFPYNEILDCYVGYLEPDTQNYFGGDTIVAMKKRYEISISEYWNVRIIMKNQYDLENKFIQRYIFGESRSQLSVVDDYIGNGYTYSGDDARDEMERIAGQ